VVPWGYEKVDPATGERFTWGRKESLEELARPKRIDEMKGNHVKILQAERSAEPDRPLLEILADVYDEDNEDQGCLICHL